MSRACRAGRPRHLTGPRILGPAEARWALDASVGPVTEPLVAALVLDGDRRVALATVFDGATATDVPAIIDLLLQALAAHNDDALVLAVYRPGGSALPFRSDRETAASAVASCDAAGVELLEVFLVAGPRSRSLLATPWGRRVS